MSTPLCHLEYCGAGGDAWEAIACRADECQQNADDLRLKDAYAHFKHRVVVVVGGDVPIHG